jgi:hypothetical protein
MNATFCTKLLIRLTTVLLLHYHLIDCSEFDDYWPLPVLSELPSLGMESISIDSQDDLLLTCDWSKGLQAYTKETLNSFRIRMLLNHEICADSRQSCPLIAQNQLIGWWLPGQAEPIHNRKTCALIKRPPASGSGVYACVFNINYVQYMRVSFWKLISVAVTQLRFACEPHGQPSSSACLAKYEFNVTFTKSRANNSPRSADLWTYNEIRDNCFQIKSNHISWMSRLMAVSRLIKVALLLAFILFVMLVVHLQRIIKQRQLIYLKHQQLVQQIAKMKKEEAAQIEAKMLQPNVADQSNEAKPEVNTIVAQIHNDFGGDFADFIPMKTQESPSNHREDDIIPKNDLQIDTFDRIHKQMIDFDLKSTKRNELVTTFTMISKTKASDQAAFQTIPDERLSRCEWRAFLNRQPRLLINTSTKKGELQDKLVKTRTESRSRASHKPSLTVVATENSQPNQTRFELPAKHKFLSSPDTFDDHVLNCCDNLDSKSMTAKAFESKVSGTKMSNFSILNQKEEFACKLNAIDSIKQPELNQVEVHSAVQLSRTDQPKMYLNGEFRLQKALCNRPLQIEFDRFASTNRK